MHNKYKSNLKHRWKNSWEAQTNPTWRVAMSWRVDGSQTDQWSNKINDTVGYAETLCLTRFDFLWSIKYFCLCTIGPNTAWKWISPSFNWVISKQYCPIFKPLCPLSLHLKFNSRWERVFWLLLKKENLLCSLSRTRKHSKENIPCCIQ